MILSLAALRGRRLPSTARLTNGSPTGAALRRRRPCSTAGRTSARSGFVVPYAAAALLPLLLAGSARAHSLDASAVYATFDQNTQALLDQRIDGGWTPGTPLIQNGDELGIVIKAIPDNGTYTGVGGYTTFYIPDGVQVTDAAYLMPGSNPADGIDGYDKVPMKGQALMPNVGAAGGPTVSLVGLVRGPNIAGVTAPLVSALNVNNGTLPAVYGDLGIFYSTSPSTAYGTYSGGTLKNNSGDIVGWRTNLGTPLNAWDAWQLAGYGIAGTTNPAYPSTPLLDSNGRGNTAWGLANAVAGPQSGYAWEFDFPKYTACDPAPYSPSTTCLNQATQDVGPWNRIKYDGSQIAYDVPGDTTPGYFTGGLDASDIGFDLVTGDLPPTTGQSDGSPNAVRWAYGQLTFYKPEFVWVKIRINDYSTFLDPSGCPVFNVDTFGGDAGNDDNGKDHIWRYYDPNSVTWDGCLAVSKPANRDVVRVGDTLQYAVRVYNLGVNAYSNVVVRDTVPTGATFLSAVPAQSSGPNPLVWNVGPLLPGQAFEAIVSVKALSSGILTNTVCAEATGQGYDNCAQEKTSVGSIPLLSQAKSVSPTSVAPGGTVQYTITIDNIGSGPTGNPVKITELLPNYFSYAGPVLSAVVNEANVTSLVTVNATNPSEPIFTIPAAIRAGKQLVLVFQAQVAANAPAGQYCNAYVTAEGVTKTSTGTLACVDVGGGAIGDTAFRDWDNDGIQDADEEGLAGVAVSLYAGACPPGGGVLATATTDANGFYQFTGLTAGSYCVVPTGPGGYALTTGNAQTTVTLTTNEKRDDVDFGYLPSGTGSIGDTVFDDQNADGLLNGTDAGIPNVTVRLYEDTNGNGTIDSGDALVATTSTGPGGGYLFSGLATGIRYIADVVESDPDLSLYFGGAPNVIQTTPGVHGSGVLAGAYLAADFGFYKTVPGAIGDDVFIDLDSDGLRDPGEAGLPNVAVSLYSDSNGNGVVDPGEPLLGTADTDANGNYSFTNLPAGNYLVDVDETDADIPAQVMPAVGPIAVLLGTGQVRTDVDFPFVTGLTKTVDKTYDDPTVAPNELNYTLAPRNTNSTLLLAAQVSDTIPGGTTYVTSNAGGEPLDNTDPPDGIIDGVLWQLGSNVPGSHGYLGGSPDPACTTTLTVEANADTWINQSDVNQQYGAATTLRTTNAVNDNVGLLRFPISSTTLPAGATFIGAQLYLAPDAGAGTNRQVAVHSLLTPFVEGVQNNANCTSGAAWQGPNCTDDWASAGGDFGTSDYGLTSLATFDPLTNDVAIAQGSAALDAAVSGWLTGGSNFGVAMIPIGSAANNVDWHVRTDATASLRPRIVLTYGTSGCSGQTIIRDSGANEVPDTYIQQDSGGNDNYGTATSLKTRPEATKNKHPLVRFDLTALPAGVDIDSAVMQMTVKTDKTNQTQSIRRLLTPWLEGTSATNGAQWNDPNGTGTAGVWSAGAFSASDYDATSYGTISPSPKGIKTANITPLVQGWYDGSFSNNGVVLLSSGTSTADAEYYSSEEGTASRRPTLTVNWSVTPVDASGSSTITTGWTLAQNGDSFPVTMTLTNSGPAIAGVSPGAMTVTGVSGAGAACGAASPASQTVPAAGSATFTWTCTITSVGAVPGSVTFSTTASNGSFTWSDATSNSVIVSPLLTMQVLIDNPPGVDVVSNSAEFYDGETLLVSSNEVNTALSAGIGDRVWIDVDHDGIQDAGEGGMAGVRVFIDLDNDCQYDAGEIYDTTDGSGSYLIAGLGLATYKVCLDLTTLPSGYYPTTTTSLTYTINTPGLQITTADFGVSSIDGPAAASIGDTVWRDRDEDGVIDAGEPGLSGVTVRLYADANGNGALDAGDYVIDTAITDANGQYLFPNLPADDYLVLVDETSSVTTPYGVTTTLAAAMDLVSGTNARAVTVAAGQTYLSADFGYNWGGSIGDFAWYDKDGDGVQDGPVMGCNDANPTDECGAPGMTAVLVYDTNGNGNSDFGEPIIGVYPTDANGFYLFDNLPPGNYIVETSEQEIPAPDSSANAGLIGFMVPSTAGEMAVSLAPNQDFTNADFGFIEAAKLEGNVFYDPNRDGVFDPFEAGIGSVTVTLTGTDVSNNPVNLVTTTSPDGSYDFVVPPGSYTITYDTGATGYPDATNATSLDVFPIAGLEITGLDFGRDDSGRIGDRVWNDANGNGLQDTGETGLPGVTMLLYLDPNGDGNLADATFVDVQVTGAAGNYLFAGLPPTAGAQRYFVVLDGTTTPATFVQTGDPDEAGACTTCDAVSGPIALAASGQNLLQDFGYRSPAQYDVSGYVFRDDSLNGAKDGGEPGLAANITVQAAVDSDNDGTTDFTVSTVTDANGLYQFPGLPSGSRIVITVDESTLPSAFYQRTNDADGGIDATITISSLTSDVTDRDFGYIANPGSIAGTVCTGNGDGLCNAPEAGSPATTVTLTWAGPDNVLGNDDDVEVTRLTDGSGNYVFDASSISVANCSMIPCPLDDGLPPGTYRIVETNPPGTTSLADADGGNPDSITLALGTGAHATNQDFEDELTAQPAIGAAKSVADGPHDNGDGTFTLTYAIAVQNPSVLTLTNVQVTDSLIAAFALAGGFTVDSVTSASLTVNPAYDGHFDLNLLTGADTLTPSAGGTISVTVTVTPGSNNGPYVNTAVASGQPPSGPAVTDLSDSGTNPDPQNTNAGAPGDTGGTDDPTPVTFEPARIGASKSISSGPVDNGNGTFTLTYEIAVTNAGVTALTAVNVNEDLTATFAGATGFTVNSVTSADFTVNPSYDGALDYELLTGVDALAPGEGGTISVTVTVTPNGNLGPYLNTAVASGQPPSGTRTSDQSDSGSNPDPDNTNPGAPGDTGGTDDPTPVLFEPSRIGVSKGVSSGPFDNGNGTFTLTYQINVMNSGTTTLAALQVSESLAATFSGSGGFTVGSVTSADFTVNGAFDGSSNVDLLAGTDALASGASGTIFVTVTVTAGGNYGPYANTAIASAQPPTGPGISDASDSGFNANPDNANPGQPGDTGGTDDPTPVTFEASRIGVAKNVANDPVDNGNGTFTLTYGIHVMNAGVTSLADIQVSENLATTFAAATGFSVDIVTSAVLVVNPAFDGAGDTDLLAPGNTLAAGQSATVFVTVTVTSDGNYGPYLNSAIASAQPPTGPGITDTSDSGVNANPDNPNPGQPGDTGGTDDPTPVSFQPSRIGAAKEVSTGPIDNGNGTFTLTYRIKVANAGMTALGNVQVTDNLSATFAGSGGFTVDTVASPDFVVNPLYDGALNIALLAAGNTLATGAFGTIMVTVTVTPGGSYGPYLNTAVASGQPPTGPVISDNSDSGANPHPDDTNPGEPGDTGGTNDPTPVDFEASRLGVSKAVVTGPIANGDGTVTITYMIKVHNVGIAVLGNVQVTENLASTFAGAGAFVADSVESPLLAVNPGFDGVLDVNLLAPGNSLAPDQLESILLTVTVTPAGNLGPYLNSALGSGQPPSGPAVTDLSDSGLIAHPDNTNSGQPGDTGGTDDPTPVLLDPCASLNCDDGVACTTDVCNPLAGSCEHTPDDSVCDDTLHCNGIETCDAVLDCVAGTPVDCDDGVDCTVDSCNEASDSCTFMPFDLLCDNALYCDGVETCNAALGCFAGTPVNCDDANTCTADTCDEDHDQCAYENLCCGDGVIQPGEDCEVSAEICANMIDDDGNGLTDCADAACQFGGCSWQCKFTEPCQCIAKDPQVMQARFPGKYKFHGRIVGSLPGSDPQNGFRIMVDSNGTTVYSATLPHDAFTRRGKYYTYRDKTAVTGIDPPGPHAGLAFARVRLRYFEGVEYATVYAKAYANFTPVNDSCITTQFQVGAKFGLLRTDWNRTTAGWRLYERDYTCAEYNRCGRDGP